MSNIEFTLDGKRYTLNQERVRNALRGQIPGRIQVHAVDVDGTYYPVKQALASALQIPKSAFISTRAVELMKKIGLRVIDTDLDGPARPSSESTRAAVTMRAREQALSLAVSHLARSGPAPVAAVLEIADQFAQWLSQSPRENELA